MSNENVYIVDDDEAVRDSLKELLESVELNVREFDSAQAFLKQYSPNMAGCMILDIRMPGKSGLELQKELMENNCLLPIIFITGHGDIPMAVEAMKRGAVEFIQKPFRDQELLDCINGALESSRKQTEDKSEHDEFFNLLESLTPREREILELIVKGSANKVIAIDLSISQRTVENHRAKIIEKMGAKSTANLIRLMIENKS